MIFESGNKAHHLSYRCSGIRHCEYAHPDILSIREAYNNVQPDQINSIQQYASQVYLSASITQKLRTQTEAYYNAAIANWTRSPYRCQFNGEPACFDRTIQVFTRNKVCIYLAYVEHLLIIDR